MTFYKKRLYFWKNKFVYIINIIKMKNILWGNNVFQKGKTLLLATTMLLSILWTSSCDNKKKAEEDTTGNIYSILNSDTISLEEKALHLGKSLAKNGKNLPEEEKAPLRKRIKNIQYAKERYEELRKHIGKEIYIIEINWRPFHPVHYYFSAEEYKNALENLWNTWIENIKKMILNEKIFKEIILKLATNPAISNFDERCFFSGKAKKLWIDLKHMSITSDLNDWES